MFTDSELAAMPIELMIQAIDDMAYDYAVWQSEHRCIIGETPDGVGCVICYCS